MDGVFFQGPWVWGRLLCCSCLKMCFLIMVAWYEHFLFSEFFKMDSLMTPSSCRLRDYLPKSFRAKEKAPVVVVRAWRPEFELLELMSESQLWWCMLIVPVIWRQQKGHSWASLASWPSFIGEFQAGENWKNKSNQNKKQTERERRVGARDWRGTLDTDFWLFPCMYTPPHKGVLV